MIEPTPSFAVPDDSPWRLAEGKDEGAMWLAWLVRLRWVAMIGQIVTLSFTFQVLDRPALLVPLLLGAIGALALTNTLALRTLRDRAHVPPEMLLMHLMVDVGVLTVFFLAAGGASNPFVMLFLVHVAMAAVMMRPRYAVLLMTYVVAVNAALHVFALPLRLDRHVLPAKTLLALGQVIAFGVTVASVGWFVLGMAGTLRRQKQRLLEARERTLRTDRLRAVGTLAAGAAHELNTPLSTVDLRVRRIARRHQDLDTKADLDVMRAQVQRCKEIVEQLLVGAGDPSASGFERAPLQEFVRRALKLWEKGATVGVTVGMQDDPIAVELPNVAFTQAFINLLENARQAQEEADVHDPLRIEVRRVGTFGLVAIHDHGPGLPAEGDRVGEPFFTTKPTGTGLGVFVARSLADGAGGGLDYARVDHRTITRWYFPETARTP